MSVITLEKQSARKALQERSGVGVLRRGDDRGMTLVELLSVMAVMTMLLAWTAPAITSLLRGSELTQAAQLVADQIALARQLSLTKNHQIEVRLYKFADPEIPGENPSSSGTWKFRAIQLFEVSESGGYRPIGKIQRFAGQSIIMDAGGDLSSIIGKATAASSVPSLVDGSTLNFHVPRVGLNYTTVAFRFMPDGSTNLAPQTAATQWFVTVHEAVKGDTLTAPPPNFATIQINPANGRTQMYHP